jgi:hypothetical protein
MRILKGSLVHWLVGTTPRSGGFLITLTLAVSVKFLVIRIKRIKKAVLLVPLMPILG